MSDRIESFSGPYRFLSNFYLIDIPFEGRVYPSVEHAFQASKCCDADVRDAFTQLRHPGTAKKIGRTLPLRPGWDTVRRDIMRQLLAVKFPAGDAVGISPLSYQLLLTDDQYLVEGNTWHDNFWGSCHCFNCNIIPGQNWLGVLLMERRSELQRVSLVRLKAPSS
jgi:ribA/ribD-fused uncharacterized protein